MFCFSSWAWAVAVVDTAAAVACTAAAVADTYIAVAPVRWAAPMAAAVAAERRAAAACKVVPVAALGKERAVAAVPVARAAAAPRNRNRTLLLHQAAYHSYCKTSLHYPQLFRFAVVNCDCKTSNTLFVN